MAFYPFYPLYLGLGSGQSGDLTPPRISTPHLVKPEAVLSIRAIPDSRDVVFYFILFNSNWWVIIIAMFSGFFWRPHNLHSKVDNWQCQRRFVSCNDDHS